MILFNDLKLERANFIDAVELYQICKNSIDQEMTVYKEKNENIYIYLNHFFISIRGLCKNTKTHSK